MAKKKVKIAIDEYNYKCTDGCCDHYGLSVQVDGVELPCENMDLGTQVRQILEHLGYEVDLIETYNGESC